MPIESKAHQVWWVRPAWSKLCRVALRVRPHADEVAVGVDLGAAAVDEHAHDFSGEVGASGE